MMRVLFLRSVFRSIRGAGGVLALLAAFGAQAQEQWSQWVVDFDEGKKSWKEIEAKIPAYPKPENLLSFEAVKASGHRYFVDAQSLSLGEDGVVRYVLVINTAGGATNVTFEGIRCETREQKYYAVAQPAGGWTRARDPQWRRIGLQETNQHGTLFGEYFCADRPWPTKPQEIMQRLKYGGNARFGGPTPE
jgi:hypothetical protein